MWLPAITAVALCWAAIPSARLPAATIPVRSSARTSAVSSRASVSPGGRSLLRPSWCAAGYGIYDDTSVYLTSVLQLAQQAPLSKSLSVENSASAGLRWRMALTSCPSITANTFAVDPNFRVGYAQTWQLSIQRDLPGALQLTASYLGVKGTRGVQQFLPNTYPIGAANPCPSLSGGFCLPGFGR